MTAETEALEAGGPETGSPETEASKSGDPETKVAGAGNSGTEASKTEVPLPPIPVKRYFTIGEVGELCDIKPHVLRYWETEFPQLKPMKRRGNRRYYVREDVVLVRQIRSLLYEEGYTISGARHRLTSSPDTVAKPAANPGEIKALIRDLEAVIAKM